MAVGEQIGKQPGWPMASPLGCGLGFVGFLDTTPRSLTSGSSSPGGHCVGWASLRRRRLCGTPLIAEGSGDREVGVDAAQVVDGPGVETFLVDLIGDTDCQVPHRAGQSRVLEVRDVEPLGLVGA